MKTRTFQRKSGRTIIELTIASAAMVAILGAAIPAFMRIAKAGDEGRTQTFIESDNRASLAKIGRELQNTSLTLLNPVGQPVFGLAPDTTNLPSYLVKMDLPEQGPDAPGPHLVADDAMGGPGGGGGTTCLACILHLTIAHTCGLADGTQGGGSANGMGGTPLNPNNSGSGRRGATHAGRTRATSTATYTFGSGTDRARRRTLPGNSIMTFQKVTGYSIDPSGEPVLAWSTPIVYRAQGRSLVRVQDGRTIPISRNCSCFYVEQTDSGTVVISIVSQRRAPGAASITKHANQIEVRPKN